MQIAVMGAGAIGSLFGALLAREGYDVTLIGREAHVKAILERGLRVSGLEEFNIRIKAFTRAVEADLFLFTVKSYDTEQAARAIPVGGKTVVLTLQNGIGNEEIIASVVGVERVISGKTSYGSTLVEPGHIRYTGAGETIVGELDGRVTERVRAIAELFNSAGIKTSIARDMRMKIWEKLIINAGINAITAITGLKNGEILKFEELKELMRLAIEEAVAVARASGIAIRDDMVERTEAVARATAENQSSMLQDVKRGKRTEIEAINGAIVKLGERYGIPTPVNRALTALVKGIEGRRI
ncbi:MAG: 2-dehydropantoate 2-reductase [Methanocellales archaeon]